MTQLALPLTSPPDRVEHKPTEVSWREGSETISVYLGARCVDYTWPWWTPWNPWNAD